MENSPISKDTGMSKIRWRLFGVLFLITLINLVDRISLSIAMPTISQEFGLSPSMQGLILSSFFWSYALCQIPSGWLIDKFGSRKVISGATLTWGIFQTLMGLVSGGVAMMAMRFGLGFSEAPVFPAGGKLNASWLAFKERARGAAIMDAGSPLGAAIGGILIAQLILMFNSWRAAFVIAGLATIATAWLAWHYLRDTPEEHSQVNSQELAHIHEPAPAKIQTFQDSSQWNLPIRSVSAMCLGRAAWAMIYFGLLTWGPTYLAKARGLDLKEIGTSTFFIFFTAMLGSLFGGFFCDYLVSKGITREKAVKGMILVSGLATLGALVGLSQVSDVSAAIALLCVSAFFLMWGSLYWSFPALIAPPARTGLIGSYMNFAGSCGGIAIPIVTGLVLEATGSFVVVILFFATCALFYVVLTFFIDLSKSH